MAHLWSRKSSTALSFAALSTPVIVPPARPAAYERSIDGYLARSGTLNVKSPILNIKNTQLL